MSPAHPWTIRYIAGVYVAGAQVSTDTYTFKSPKKRLVIPLTDFGAAMLHFSNCVGGAPLLLQRPWT
jgi:hypothetical protein